MLCIEQKDEEHAPITVTACTAKSIRQWNDLWEGCSPTITRCSFVLHACFQENEDDDELTDETRYDVGRDAGACGNLAPVDAQSDDDDLVNIGETQPTVFDDKAEEIGEDEEREESLVDEQLEDTAAERVKELGMVRAKCNMLCTKDYMALTIGLMGF